MEDWLDSDVVKLFGAIASLRDDTHDDDDARRFHQHVKTVSTGMNLRLTEQTTTRQVSSQRKQCPSEICYRKKKQQQNNNKKTRKKKQRKKERNKQTNKQKKKQTIKQTTTNK